ncbi:MAG TPA: hypothetical protein VGK32_08460 [Vicinamibacterales bacterium]
MERIGGTAKLPDKVDLIDSDGMFRGATMCFDSARQPIWIVKHEGPANELRGVLASAFVGEVLWTGQLKSIRVDPKTGDGRLELMLP